jgi:hypothetical protein
VTQDFRWALVCVASFLVGVVAIGWPAIANDGFPLDDSWIHQTIGRNAAQYGVPGFVSGLPSSGSSSAIWPWIIALNYRLLPSVSPVVYLLIFNSLCLLTILATLFVLAKHDGLSAFEGVLFTCLAALTGNLVWLISTGMEHLLYVALLFAATAFWLHPRLTGYKSALAAGALCGLALLTRPEAIALLPLFLFAGLRRGKSRNEVLAFLQTCAIATLLLAFNNLWLSHSFSLLPGTIGGRRWLVTPGSELLRPVARFARDSAVHIVRYVLGIDVGNIATATIVALTAVVIFASLAGLVRRSAWRICFLVALAAANFGVYCVVLPSTGNGMRYQSITLVLVFPLVAFGLRALVDRVTRGLAISKKQQHICRGTVTTVIAGLAMVTLVYWNQITDVGIKHINGTHVRMGQWLAQHMPAGTPVASFDIGAVSYFSGARIIDLGGLANPEVIPYLYAKQLPAYLRARSIRWVVLPVLPAPNTEAAPDDSCEHTLSLCTAAGLTKLKVVSFTSPFDMWNQGEQATAHAARSQWLYDVTWR